MVSELEFNRLLKQAKNRFAGTYRAATVRERGRRQES
jgi:hypothetical protein